MRTALQSVSAYSAQDHLIILADPEQWGWATGLLSEAEIQFARNAAAQNAPYISMTQGGRVVVLEFVRPKKDHFYTQEAARKAAAKRIELLRDYKVERIVLVNTAAENFAYFYAEGFILGNYQFHKYYGTREPKTTSIKTLAVLDSAVASAELDRLAVVLDSVQTARDWVNEPLSTFNAVQMSEAFLHLVKDTPNITSRVLQKAEIEALGMGGLLGVNKGSVVPPTFTILEYKPANAKNEHPIVLVGKGIVYDTGGLSIKPTPDSMDHMKCDMAGAAVVVCGLHAAARTNLPLHLIALVPATDNLVDANSYVPGDILHAMSGATIEMLNADAEGRLILADALHYAKQYNPELVFDFATLTGAAARAIGQVGCVYMGNADESVKAKVAHSGYHTHERGVEFPLWEEYFEMIKSEIADIRNIGGPLAGASTAGKFLEYFTDYPWIHFDIAAPAFFQKEDGYLVKGGSGWGVRFLYDFLAKY